MVNNITNITNTTPPVVPPPTTIIQQITQAGLTGNTGPQGLRGLTGLQGLKGDKGEPGASSNIDTSLLVSKSFLTSQVDRIYDSTGDSIQGLSISLAKEINTKLLTVSGDTTVGGNLTVTGNLIGNVTGNVDTATALLHSRTIAGVSFDGTSNISISSTNLSDTTNIARLDATNAFTNTGNTSFAGNVGVGTTAPTSLLTIKGITTEASLGSELITATADRDFSGAGSWSGTNWSVGSGVITHTAGANTLTLPTLTIVSGNVYQITFDINTTVAGTLTPSIGGVNSSVYGQSVATLLGQVEVITATGAGAFTFTPNANWTGTIDNVSVKQITTAPSLFTFLNSDGTTGMEVRSGGSGLQNTFAGVLAGQVNTTGTNNTANGFWALLSNTTGHHNTATGVVALSSNTTGNFNGAYGWGSLNRNTTGSDNSAYGLGSLPNNTTGSFNTASGRNSLSANTTGSSNSAFGYKSGGSLTTGSSNIVIGQYVDLPISTGSQQLNIGNLIYGLGIYGGSSSSSTPVTAGALGIGSSSKLSRLTVTAPADVTNIGGTTTANASTTITGVGTTFTTSLGIGDRISLSSSSSTYATVTAITSDTSLTISVALGDGTSQTIKMKKSIFRLDDASNVTKVVVNDQGYVGIGTTSPNYKLDVQDNPSNVSSPTLRVLRTFDSTAVSPIITALFQNTGEVIGGSDYQNEVHLRLKAGTTANHRRYINFADYNGDDQWLTGVNASGDWILFSTDVVGPGHKLWIQPNGITQINSAGTASVEINHNNMDSYGGTGGLKVYGGGVTSPILLDVAPSGLFAYTKVAIGTATLPVQELVINGDMMLQDGTGNDRIGIYGRTQSSFLSQATPAIYYAGGAGSYPFNLYGDLVIQPRSNAIRDIVFAGYDGSSVASRMVIQGGGNVGIGTTTPIGTLHTVGEGNMTLVSDMYYHVGGNALIFRTANGSKASPTATATNDFLGAIVARGYSTDGTPGFSSGNRAIFGMYAAENFTSTAQGTYLTLGTTPIGSATRAERMRVLDNGNIGIGVTAPLLKLQTSDSQASNAVGYFVNTDTGTAAEGLRVGLGAAIAGTGNLFVNFFQNATAATYGTSIGYIAGTGGGAISYTSISDARVKENMVPTTKGLEDLMKIQVEDFNYKSAPDHTVQGFIAQDLNLIYPYAVATNGDNGTDPLTPDATPWGVDYGRITPLIVKSVQEMNLKVEDLSSLDINKATSLGSLIKSFLESETGRLNKIFAKTVVTEGIEMTDSATGEVYCVVITNGELVKTKGKCGAEVVTDPSPTSTPLTPEQTEAARVAKIDTDLTTAKTTANDKVEADYTGESWILFTSARSIALALPEIVEAQTQTELEANKTAKTKALNDAMALLVPTTPAPELSNMTAYDAALSAKAASDYTGDSWTVYQGVLDANKVTNTNTQAEVDTAKDNIIAAQGSLIKTPTCTDGIKNQDETDIDVGGVCTPA